MRHSARAIPKKKKKTLPSLFSATVFFSHMTQPAALARAPRDVAAEEGALRARLAFVRRLAGQLADGRSVAAQALAAYDDILDGERVKEEEAGRGEGCGAFASHRGGVPCCRRPPSRRPVLA